ncbi:MAG TPA: (Fe-S)-binding protein, partial [Polyangiaceae bacterium]|nr:(Fe-S)-binding protein [Polyangiaceae bacterium]
SIPSPTEAEIQQVLERTGKSRPEDELNCGACGYGTCRAKAIAVIQGMADPAVCIPMMRRLAEQRSDRIMDTSPNGILILDQRLNVLAMNPAFRALFRCTDAQLGTHVSALMDPEPFQKLAAGAEQRTDLTATHRKHGVVCREILYKIPDDQQLVGIFINITQTERERESLAQLRRQTMAQGRELLEHQIEMAQQLTRYLGESTAKGETLLQNLLKVARDPAEERGDETMKWLWDIYTSKS